MKKLNESGINKVLSYIGKTVNESSDIKYTLNELAEMAKIGVICENNNLYYIYEEELDNIDDTKAPVVDGGDDDKNMDKLIEHLSTIFVTKQEVNDALNNLKSSMIDPQEWMEILNMQKKMLSKHSKSTDEIG